MAAAQVSLEVVPVDKPADMNAIIGQAHFIKTVDDLHEALAGVSPHLRPGWPRRTHLPSAPVTRS
jgi:adenosine/AMP kinase